MLLVSFAGQEEIIQLEVTTHPRRVYAVVSLRHLPGAFQILKVRAVPYQSVSVFCIFCESVSLVIPPDL